MPRDTRSGALLVVLLWAAVARGQEPRDIRDLPLRDWEPRSVLFTATTAIERPAFPVIDVHNHLGGGRDFLTPQRVRGYLDAMDAAGVETVVNLDDPRGAPLPRIC